MGLVCCKDFEDYLPMAVNAIVVLSADIVSPARACMAFECMHKFKEMSQSSLRVTSGTPSSYGVSCRLTISSPHEKWRRTTFSVDLQ